MEEKAKELIQTLLAEADIKVNGSNPWDIQIHDDNFYQRIMRQGALGLGESYMDAWWDAQSLEQFFFKVLTSRIQERVSNKSFLTRLLILKFLNLFNKKRVYEVGEVHYDLGHRLFSAMLDPKLVYTCAYWKEAVNLEEAQVNKLRMSCDKLYLKPGMKLLDIGCGWGALAKYAAENYDVSVVGITISKEQYEYAKKLCKGLPIEIRLQDYREVDEKFDRVVSLGMFEHVGCLNYRAYMEVAYRCLDKEGIFLLHTIGDNLSEIEVNAWTAKYIFPNSMLPSIAQIGKSIEGLFVMEDWHNFGIDYAKTLLAWHKNFNDHWGDLKQHYDDRFYRMWTYYLLSSAGAFLARYIQLWQIVLSKEGVKAGYLSFR